MGFDMFNFAQPYTSVGTDENGVFGRGLGWPCCLNNSKFSHDLLIFGVKTIFPPSALGSGFMVKGKNTM